MIRRFDRWLRDLAWPTFACEDCIGMSQYGCYCSYYNAVAPSAGPGEWHLFLRALHGLIFIWTSEYWTDARTGLDHV